MIYFILFCLIIMIAQLNYEWFFEKLKALIDKGVKLLSWLRYCLKTKGNNRLKFEDLTPNIPACDVTDEHKVYLESLEWAIQNEEIKNIAVSGYYGTGKSTLLNSFVRTTSGFKYLSISLAKFRDDKSSIDDIEIEISILQQIFYYEKSDNLADSRLKRIKHNKFATLKSIFVFLWMVCALFIMKKSWLHLIADTIPNLTIHITTFLDGGLFLWFPRRSFLNYAVLIYFLWGIVVIVKYLYTSLVSLKISKLSLSDAELIPADDKNNSSLNKNLDEIIYFFQKTKITVVLIEDLDRFNKPELFVKLREINTLINNCKDIKRKVKFIYAIKDDVFTQDDRTKFFDFIIPVIPIINYKNSREFFIRKLEEDYIKKDLISHDFIKDIAPYISDMRVLKNIINEFKIYEEIKKNENRSSTLSNRSDAGNWEKLMSLIIYKNIYPNDFTLLQHRMGILYDIIQAKSKINEKLKQQKLKEIEAKETELQRLNKEQLKNLDELRSVYVGALMRRVPNIRLVINQSTYINDLVEPANFEILKQESNIEYSTDSWYASRRSNISFKQIEKEVDPKNSYADRERFINSKANDEIEDINQHINNLHLQISGLENTSYAELIQTDYKSVVAIIEESIHTYTKNALKKEMKELSEIDLEIEINERKTKYNLLKVLVENNYIDENYLEYISYFHAGSLTAKDNRIKMNIIEGKVQPYETSIDHVQNLIEDLAVHNFKRESILNFQILEWLLVHQAGNDPRRMHFIATISNLKPETAQFTKGFILYAAGLADNDECLSTFIISISEWRGFWNLVMQDKFSQEEKNTILGYILIYAGHSEIKALNYNSKLDKFINDSFQVICNISYDALNGNDYIQILKILRVQFKSLYYDESNPEILNEIVANKLYELNHENIKVVIENFSGDTEKKSKVENANYTSILESEYEPLISYVEENFESYIENVFLKLVYNVEEAESTLIKIIETANLSDNLIREVLSRQITMVSTLEKLDENKWEILFSNKKIEPRWPNIVQYFKFKEGMDNSLETYLDNVDILKALRLDDSYYDEQYEDEKLLDEFNLALIQSNISDVNFDIIVSKLSTKFDDISDLNFSPYRISKLIDYENIPLTKENFDYLKSKYKDQFEKLLLNNEIEFIAKVDEYTLDDVSIVFIFESHNLDEIKKLILEKDMIEASRFPTSAMNTIIDFLIESKFVGYSYDLFNSIMESGVMQENKIRILSNYLHHLSDDQLNTSLESVGNPYSRLLTKEKIVVENYDYNLRLLQQLRGPKFFKRIFKIQQDNYLTISY